MFDTRREIHYAQQRCAVYTSKGELVMTVRQRDMLNDVIGGLHVAKRYSEKQLRALAIQNYKEQWKDTPFMLESVRRASRSQVEQWMVNYVRHELTGYDEAWRSIHGKIPGGYEIVKHAVLDKIAEMYPFLHKACQLQKSAGFRTW